jgi:cytoskeleton protein RodZ
MVIAASVLMVAAVLIYVLPERAWNGLVLVMSAWPKAALPASSASAPGAGAEAVNAAVAASAPAAAASASDADPALPATAGEGPVGPAMPAATATTAAAAAAAAGLVPARLEAAEPRAAAAAATASAAVPVPARLAARSADSAAAPVLPGPDQGLAMNRAARLRTTSKSWVEARDATGQVLLSRMVDAGETVELAGALPLRLLIGNVSGTHLDFRGQSVDLASRSRDNVARIELR